MEEFKFFSPQEIDPTLFFVCFGGLALLIFVIVYGTYRYRKFKKFQEFVDEMNMLELDDEQENALSGMVKRYAMQEPVQILVSRKVFDEMAAKEINRVLGSSGSMNAKQTFINMVYEIRRKTYDQEWPLQNEEDEKNEKVDLTAIEAAN